MEANIFVDLAQSMKGFSIVAGANYRRVLEGVLAETAAQQYTVQKFKFSGTVTAADNYYYWVIKEHFGINLFCGIRPFRARPTGEALRGIYGWPGDSRGARRSAGAFEELLQGIAAAWGTQEYRTDGGASGPGQRPADAPVLTPFGGQGALER
jgi:hypothetical protein